jgi:hypothetical protein
MDALDPQRFHAVRLDEAMAGIRAWTHGRVMLGSDGINERLAWATLANVPTVVPLTLTSGCDAPTEAELEVRAAGRDSATSIRLAPHASKQVNDLKLTASDEGTSAASVILRAGGHELRSEASLTVVPCKTAAKEASFAACWSATGLSHRSGAVIPEPSALWGKAWASPDPAGKSDCIVFGPYAAMPAGRYLAAFRVKLADDAPADVTSDALLATLDMFAGGYSGNAKVTGQTEVYRRDFAAPGQWRWFGVEGNWAGLPSLMETRVTWEGRARIIVDRIVLFRLR